MTSNIKYTVGSRLREFRGDYLTQKDLAELLRISPIGYQNYEYGKRIPPELLTDKIAILLGTTPRALLYGETASDRNILLSKLTELSQKGVEDIEELRFLSGLIDRAYFYAPEKNVTAAWVVSYYEVLKILRAKTENYESTAPYLEKISLMNAGNAKKAEELSDWLEASLLPRLLASTETEKKHGFYIARAVSILLLYGDVTLTNRDWQQLREKLHPWAFWVARHALFADKCRVDASLLVESYSEPQREKVEVHKTYISITIFFAKYMKKGSLLTEEKKLSAGLTIREGKRRLVTFAVSAGHLHDLISAVRLLKNESRSAKKGNWEIRWEPEYDSIFVQKEDVRVYLLKDQMEEFLSVVKEISKDPDIRRDLAFAQAAEYGAI